MTGPELEALLAASLVGNKYELPLSCRVEAYPIGSGWGLWFISDEFASWPAGKRSSRCHDFVVATLTPEDEKSIYSATGLTEAQVLARMSAA